MYWLLREMQVWLHRHIFKVGWLVTKNFETTTILYYTVFLPGVFLNQLSTWLAAGAANVRAERAIRYPEKQEIGELKLDFVKVKKASPIVLNLIQLIPFIVGLIIIWLIAVHALDIFTVLDLLGDPDQGLGLSLQYMFTRPDFWLWAYFVFTIANTMLPDTAVFKGMRLFVIIGIIIFVLMIFDGNTGDISGVVVPPILSISNGLSLLFCVIIAVDAVATLVLAAIENTIEVITGDSATFKNGKMIAMKRADVIAQRKADREKEQRKREREKAKAIVPASTGPPSVYALELPLPDPPGEIPRRLILESEEVPELDIPRHRDPDVIVTDDVKSETSDDAKLPSYSAPPSPFIRDRVRTKPSEYSPSDDDDDASLHDETAAHNETRPEPEVSAAKPFVPVSRRSHSPLSDGKEDKPENADGDRTRPQPTTSDRGEVKSATTSDETRNKSVVNSTSRDALAFNTGEKSSEIPAQQRKPLIERRNRYASVMGQSETSDAKSKEIISAKDEPAKPATNAERPDKSRVSNPPIPEEPRAKPTGLLKNRGDKINPFVSRTTKPVPKPESVTPSNDADDLRAEIGDVLDDDDEIVYEDLEDDYIDDVSEDEIDERL